MTRFLCLLILALFFTLDASAQDFATMNPSDKNASVALSGGDLTVSTACTICAWIGVRSTQGKSSGKHYYEATVDTVYNLNAAYLNIGVANSSASLSGAGFGEADANGWAFSSQGCRTHSGYSCVYAQFVTGDVLGFLLDLDADTLTIYKNGSALTGGAFTGVTGTVYPAASLYVHAALSPPAPPRVTFNFGASDFVYDPPEDYAPGWFEGEIPGEGGLWVCAAVSAGACVEWITLVDEIASIDDLGVSGANLAIAFASGAGLVFFFVITGTMFGGLLTGLSRALGGSHE